MRVCPACSEPAVEFIPEASGDVCTECGYTVDVVVLDHSKEIADGHGLTLWQDGMATVLQPIGRAGHGAGGGWLAQSKDKENVKMLEEQRHLRDIRTFIRGTLNHLGRQRYRDRAFGLFDTVRRAALERTERIRALWNPPHADGGAISGSFLPDDVRGGLKHDRKPPPKLISWGLKAKALAIACVYATIATAERDSLISLQQVLSASGEPYTNAAAVNAPRTSSTPSAPHSSTLSYRKVAKRLRLVRDLGGPSYAHLRDDAPRFYLEAMLDFFEAARQALDAPSNSAPSSSRGSRKGKERAQDANGPQQADGVARLLSEELSTFLAHVNFPKARNFALQLARTLEDAIFPLPSGPSSSEPTADPQPMRARDGGLHADLTAFAIVMWAMEASGRTPGPQLELIALNECARLGPEEGLELLRKREKRQGEETSNGDDDEGNSPGGDDDEEMEMDGTSSEEGSEGTEGEKQPRDALSSKSTLQLRYSDIRRILNDAAKHIPWVLSASILASGRRRGQQGPKKAAAKDGVAGASFQDVDSALDMSRLDIIRWMSDILVFREAALRRKEVHDSGKAGSSTVHNAEQAPVIAVSAPCETGGSSRPADLVFPPNEDSTAVSRVKRRLRERGIDVPAEAEDGTSALEAALTALEEAGESAGVIDAILFGSPSDDEDDADVGHDGETLNSLLRPEPERRAREVMMREDGVWEEELAQAKRREERERVLREREARKRARAASKLLRDAARGDSSASAATRKAKAGEKRKRNAAAPKKPSATSKRSRNSTAGLNGGNGEQEATNAEREDEMSDLGDWDDDDGDDDEDDEEDGADHRPHLQSSKILRADWGMALNLSLQTEDWSDSSEEDDD